VDKAPAPSLLPIFRSQQQAEILTLLLGEPAVEYTLADLVERTDAPYASVHREVERAETAGLTTSRLVGRTRLVRANISSPYFSGLSEVLIRAFGVPWVLGAALAEVEGIDEAYIYGSWAARFAGEDGDRPVGDVDLLVLGKPDRDRLYNAISEAERRLGRPVQVTIRAGDWLTTGSGSFYGTVVTRPMVPITWVATETAREDRPAAPARRPQPRSARSKSPTSRRPR
jgi:DNA-binding transcriptional ArsR family regulator